MGSFFFELEQKYNITFFHYSQAHENATLSWPKKVNQKSLALKKATTLIQTTLKLQNSFQSNTCNFYAYLLLKVPVLLFDAHQNLTSVIINHQNFNPKLRIYFQFREVTKDIQPISGLLRSILGLWLIMFNLSEVGRLKVFPCTYQI